MSSILLANRYNQASEILLSTTAFNDSIHHFMEEKLTPEITRAVYETVAEVSKSTGGRGFKPEQQMEAMKLKSEFEWLFFDIDELVDEEFMNDTADELPDIYALICYYVLTISIVNKYE